jgi:Xaa-Pro dipeptidase
MTKEQLENHKIAAEKLEAIKNRAFALIKKNIGKISEYEVQKFILAEYEKEGMVSLLADRAGVFEKHTPQIIAAGVNSGEVHYYPAKKNSKIIKKNDLIMIDIWAKLAGDNAPFADITWMGFVGKVVPPEILKTFKQVIGARNAALDYIRAHLKAGIFPKTRDIDGIARNYFKKLGLAEYFPHRLGHSLGLDVCHGHYFRFKKTSRARLRPDIPFTIEPGLYYKNNFGIRSEIDCYVTKNYRLIITTKVQDKMVKI